MRSYGQYCGLAKALDLVGDRWTLLIVRELLLRGPCRYTDLVYGLPGIATNLLADRLRTLEESGIVARRDEPPPVATALFALTPRGRELEETLRALGRWGGRALEPELGSSQTFRSHWLGLPFSLYLRDTQPTAPPTTITVTAGEQPVTVTVANGQVETTLGAVDEPDLAISGPPGAVLSLLLGRISQAEARRRGVRLTGSTHALHRIRPAAREPEGAQP